MLVIRWRGRQGKGSERKEGKDVVLCREDVGRLRVWVQE